MSNPQTWRGSGPARRHGRPLLVFAALLAIVPACGVRSTEPPAAGYDRGGIPDLRGERVILLPPQSIRGGHGDVERELVFALAERGSEVDWVTPERLRERMVRSPEVRIELDRLPIDPFLTGRLERIGDPLFGELYRLGIVEDAEWALLPIEIRERPAEDRDGGLHVEVVAAFLQLRTGRVLWFGVLDGVAGAAGAPGPTASAAESLARRIVP